MQALPLRIPPGQDLRRALEDAITERDCRAAFVITGIGSLTQAAIRWAGRPGPNVLDGDLEILSLAGTLSPDGAHLHISVADAEGRIVGGHLGYGSRVRTTAEVLLMLLPDWSFSREIDANTGFSELVIRSEARP
jgi:uncharacterized protein